MKKIFAFSVAILFNLIIASVALAADNLQSIAPIDVAKLTSGEQTLRISGINNFPPFSYRENNILTGILPEIFKEVAKRVGIKNYTFVDFPLNAKIRREALRAGKVDLLLHTWDEPASRKDYLLTIPYYVRGGVGALYLKGSQPYKKVDDLKDHTIGVLKEGYTQFYWLPRQNIPSSSIKIKTYASSEEALAALKRKEIDAFVSYFTLIQHDQSLSQDQLEATLIAPGKASFAVRRQDEALLQLLNRALKSMWADGTLYTIKKKYLHNLGIEPARSYK